MYSVGVQTPGVHAWVHAYTVLVSRHRHCVHTEVNRSGDQCSMLCWSSPPLRPSAGHPVI